MAEYEQVGRRTPDGIYVGAASTEKVGLYGETPVDQAAAITAPLSTAIVANTSTLAGYGFATSAQADAWIAAVKALVTAKKEFGEIASA